MERDTITSAVGRVREEGSEQVTPGARSEGRVGSGCGRVSRCGEQVCRSRGWKTAGHSSRTDDPGWSTLGGRMNWMRELGEMRRSKSHGHLQALFC